MHTQYAHAPVMSDSLISQKAAPSDTWRQFLLPPSTLLTMKLTPAISNARDTNSTFNAICDFPLDGNLFLMSYINLVYFKLKSWNSCSVFSGSLIWAIAHLLCRRFIVSVSVIAFYCSNRNYLSIDIKWLMCTFRRPDAVSPMTGCPLFRGGHCAEAATVQAKSS